MEPLVSPIAVFDAGIGSYAIVDLIHRRLPRQDIVYLADRASFPYGGKDRVTLLETMRRTIGFLEQYSPSMIVIASNAPSIMVLDALNDMTTVPLRGIRPPLAEALRLSATGRVGIMAVRSLIESPLLTAFVHRWASDPAHVACIDASTIVELVESGRFLFDPVATQRKVDELVGGLRRDHPAIDVITLSSTHLPWLRPFLERAAPKVSFIDPAEAMVASLGRGSQGTGRILGVVTETPDYPLATFRRMLEAVGVDIPIEPTKILKG